MLYHEHDFIGDIEPWYLNTNIKLCFHMIYICLNENDFQREMSFRRESVVLQKSFMKMVEFV
jgi:hypothetical protein